MIRGLDHFELLRPAHDLSGFHGLPNGLDCDRGLPVVQGHIRPGDMAFLREDPRQDAFEFRFILLGDNPG